MRLLERIQSSGCRSVSVVGLAKNAGKTVAVNSIIRQCADAGVTLGLSSIGYDGEKIDVLSRLAKPRIAVREGTVLATATGTLPRAAAGLEILAATNYITALGEVMLVRARESGNVEIAGPDSFAEMRHCIAAMQALGCQLIIVDGALDRVGSAAPTITDGTVIATGAVAGSNMRRILMRSMHVKAIFSLPEVSDLTIRQGAIAAMEAGQLVVLDSDGVRALPFTSALGHAAAVIGHLSPAQPFSLVIPGALTDSLVGELIYHHRLVKQVCLISPDPTHIFVSPEIWQRFVHLGGRAVVLKSIRILAVTVNPTAPTGKSYTPRDFAEELARALAPLPVYDLFLSDEEV
ncbi:MAG: hypothetical protein KGZ66_05180 [Selenomonadales bacterium]|nr:hypothetical protein [Selenomonadales bacterium]